MVKTKSNIFSLRLPPGLRKKADELAKSKKWALGTLIIDLLEKAIKENETG